MAIAHICESCGHDLSRRAALLDAEYALPIVICPACQRGSVRIQHPIIITMKRMLRLQAAIERLLVQLVGIAIFATLSVTAMGLAIEIADRRWDEDDMFLFGLIFLVIIPVVMGTWLTAAFSHIRIHRLWIGWSLLILLSAGIIALYIGLCDALYWWPWGPRNFRVPAGSWLQDAQIAAAAFGAMMVVALVGIPLGLLLRWGARRFHSWRWSWRRRRLRTELHSG